MSLLRYTDAYKLGRILEYPENTTVINEVLVPRNVKYLEKGLQESVEKYGIIVAGIEYAIQQTETIIGLGSRRVSTITEDYKAILGKDIPPQFRTSLKELAEYFLEHRKLPLIYKYIPEGTLVPVGTPICIIENTDDRFYWLPNFIETIFLSHCWLAIVNATKNFHLRLKFEEYAIQSADSNAYIDWQGHDFSMRGLSDLSPQVSIGQLMSFKGSDTLYGIQAIKEHYKVEPNELILGSVSAFEHSSVTTTIQTILKNKPHLTVQEAEQEALLHFITDVYPSGIVAYVADSYDFWSTVANLNNIKDSILARDGKLVIRPDSGNPYDIICGFDAPDCTGNYYQQIGLIRSLDEIFGHTINSKGYKVLNAKVGAIYGDGINYARATAICEKLMELGYSAENIVFGMGATWQSFCTRDNLGIALKTTKAVVNNEVVNVVKDPKTASDASKKSPKGEVFVFKDTSGNIQWVDANSAYPETFVSIMQTYKYNEYTNFSDVRKNITKELNNILEK